MNIVRAASPVFTNCFCGVSPQGETGALATNRQEKMAKGA